MRLDASTHTYLIVGTPTIFALLRIYDSAQGCLTSAACDGHPEAYVLMNNIDDGQENRSVIPVKCATVIRDEVASVLRFKPGVQITEISEAI